MYRVPDRLLLRVQPLRGYPPGLFVDDLDGPLAVVDDPVVLGTGQRHLVDVGFPAPGPKIRVMNDAPLGLAPASRRGAPAIP